MAEPWQATLCGVLMDGTPDAHGVQWGVEVIEGWDSPDVRSSDNERTGQHGTWGAPSLFGGRPLTVKGWADCPDMAAAFAVRDRLHTLTDGVLVVHESVEKRLDVERGGVIRCTDPISKPGLITVTWWIPLKARYPFKRALDPVEVAIPTDSSATLTNPGTFAAEVTITTTSAGVVKVGAYGATLGTTTSLPTGSVLSSIDRTIVDDTGSSAYGLIARDSQWLAAPAGSTLFTNTGSAAVVVSIFPTYA